MHMRTRPKPSIVSQKGEENKLLDSVSIADQRKDQFVPVPMLAVQ